MPLEELPGAGSLVASDTQIVSEAEDVYTLCERFSRAAEGSHTSISGRTITTIIPEPLNRVFSWFFDRAIPGCLRCMPNCLTQRVAACWATLDMRPVQKAVTSENADEGLYGLDKLTREGLIFSVNGAGKTLAGAGGTLELAPEAYIIFDSSCADVMLKDVVIKGGFVVCHGSGCNVIFKKVTFEGCTLVVRDGASVALEQPSFKQKTRQDKPVGLSIFAHGTDTAVGIHQGTITGGLQGVTVQEGARFAASHLTVTKVAITALEVKDEGSVAKLTDCKLKNFLPVYNHTFSVRGVHAHAKSKLELVGAEVVGGVFGVDVREVAQAFLTNCNIRDPVQSCMALRSGADGWLEGCTLERTKMNLPITFGLYVGGLGSVAQANNTKFLEHAQSGVFVHNQATLLAHACTTSGNHVSGFVVHTKARMELTNCMSERDGKGCLVEEGGKLIALNVNVSKCEDEAFAVGEEGDAELVECTGTECGEEGVQVAHKGTVVKMESCTFHANEFDNVVVRQGAKAVLKGCMLTKSVTMSGIAVKGEGTVVDIDLCTVEGNEMCGVLADEGAVVTVKRCTSRGHKQVGYKASEGGKMEVLDSTSDGDAVGCGVGEGGEMLCRAVVVDGETKAGKLPSGK